MLQLKSAITVLLMAALLGLQGRAQAQEAVPAHEITLPESVFQRGGALPDWNVPVELPPNRPEIPTYLRLADLQIRVNAAPTLLIRRVVSANNASALSTVGQFEIVFQPDFQHVVLHSLRILRGEERINKLDQVKIKFMQRERDADYSVFTGWTTAIVIIDDLRVGDSLEVSYSLTGQNPVFNGHFSNTAGWDAGVPTGLRRITVNAPDSLRYRWRMIGNGPEAPEPTVTKAGSRRTLQFIARDQPAVETDPFTPKDESPLRWLQFSDYADWQEVVDWAGKLFKTPPLPPEFVPILAQIRAGKNEEERIVRAVSFVQNEIRYVSMSLGEHSHRPFLPHEVLSRRYGDCKDKSLLLVALLHEIGVDAHPVLLGTDSRTSLNAMLPSPLNFDHAVVRLRHAGRYWVVDPTLRRQVGHLASFGDAHPTTWILPVISGNAELIQTPPSPDNLITSTRVEQVTLDKLDGPAEMTVELDVAGLDAEQLRDAIARLTPKQMTDFYSGFLDRRYSQASLTKGPNFEDDTENNRIKVHLAYRIPTFVEGNGKAWEFHYLPSNLLGNFHIPNNARRRAALALPSYPSITRYEYRVTLPEDFDVKRRPFSKRLQGDGFSVDQDLSMTRRQALAHYEMKITADRVPAPRVASFLTDMRTLNGMLGGSFNIDEQDRPQKTAPPKPLREAEEEEARQIITSTTSQINNAKLTGQEISNSLCERARAQAYLGKRDEALADIDTALRAKGNQASLLACAGNVQYMTGASAQALQSLNRAIALGMDDYGTRFQRGLTNYYANHLPEAAEDFRVATRQAVTPSGKARASYWQFLTARRLGQNTPPLQRNAEWPDAAIALLLGQTTPEQLLAGLHESRSGQDLDSTLGEAYLYLAQYYQQRSETIRSRAHLRQALDKGAISSLLHYAAQRERPPTTSH